VTLSGKGFGGIRLGRIVRATACAAALALTAGPAGAQAPADDTNRQILQELRAIRTLLEGLQRDLEATPPAPAAQRNAPAPAPVPNDRVAIPFAPKGFTLGRTDAPLVMVEYTDYECPFCRQFHIDSFEQIKRNYIDTGKLRYVSRDFPLDFHPNAQPAAMAARCAAEQNKFWELRHTLIVNANKLGPEQVVGYARDQKLDLPRFETCLKSGRHRAAIEADMAEGRNAGVSGTPSFVIGRVANDRLEGVRIVGALPYMAFAARLDQMLQRKDVD
jgi:protein-disulfide isomerase